jgi:spore coat protein A, manganese oxidase
MRLTRREMIRLGLIGGAAAALPVAKAVEKLASVPLDQPVESPPVPRFVVPLNIPPELQPVRTEGNTKFFVVTQRVGRVQILPSGPKTTIWGYNGITPGPTIRQRRGTDHVVRQINNLSVPISTHLHGGDVPPSSDGHPLDLVQPGDFKDYFYPGIHPPANLWYHDHAIHETGRNVWMGLAGMYPWISDEEEALGLPRGRFEVPLVIQDRFFTKDNQIVYPTDDGLPLQQGVFGDVILVNGTPFPFFRVARRKYRFRILNGSNARVYKLRLSTGEPFIAIGSEGGFFPHPIEVRDITLSESERIGVVVDFSKYPIGTRIVLENHFPDLPGDPFDEEKTRQVMRFDVVDDAIDRSRVPADLPGGELPDPAQAVRTRDWVFERSDGAWVINGKLFNPNRIDAFPRLGSVEIWRFINKSGGWVHPIHPHLVEYKVLDRDGGPVRPEERGPKDTVLLGFNQEVRVAIRFNHFSGLYVMHCHNIEHEDHDMMTQFKVV